MQYKDKLTEDLKKDPRVSEVVDMGVKDSSDKTAYPHVAVAAAKMIADGMADRALLICGTGLGEFPPSPHLLLYVENSCSADRSVKALLFQRIKFRVYGPSLRTIASVSSVRFLATMRKCFAWDNVLLASSLLVAS